MSEHAFIQENLAAYLADGLTAAERERFERHVHGCGECHLLVAEHREFDESLDKLFAGVRPAAGFENRVIAALRSEPLQRRIAWTKSLRWLGSAAAVLMLGVVGYGMHFLAEGGRLPFGGEWTESQATQRVREAGSRSQKIARRNIRGAINTADVDPAAREFDADIEYNLDRKGGVSVPGEIGGMKDLPADADPNKKARDGISNTILSGEGLTKQLEVLDVTTAVTSNGARKPSISLEVHTGETKDKGNESAPTKEGGAAMPNGASDPIAMSPDGRRTVTGPGRVPTGAFGAGGPGAGSGSFGGGGFQGGGSFGGGGFQGGGMGAGGAPMGGFTMGKGQGALPGPTMGPGMGAMPGTPPGGGGGGASEGWGRLPSPNTASTPVPTAPGQNSNKPKLSMPGYYRLSTADDGIVADGDKRDDKGGAAFKTPSLDEVVKDLNKNKDPGYYKATIGKSSEESREKDSSDLAKVQAKGDPKAGGKEEPKQPDTQKFAPPAGKQVQTKPPDEQPKATARKIIRTGEVEFEVEGFDGAVSGITQLISGIPGAFVATVNSEKLPNGKVKGSVIVRMPPDHLDKFLLDMRKELTKSGELKSQRIGSQDVTKQYYDLESRLRAARTMEERLIDIIKKGKGEIKDLLLAEKELGVWRTKIEEMEGEIRYYNNQVGLSTLTITMYEKEIRSAAAMVISEHVNMKIEAEDVEKSLQAALAAVAEAKGRVTKSDLKQHSAGQYEAILQFEVAPAAAGKVKDKLKTLGVVTHHDAQRLQHAEGGVATGEIKSRVSDVQFNVALHNVANIQPREAYIQLLAVTDVVADYRKLQEAVSLAKGQVRSGNLDEKDKLNIFAQFDFDVPANARQTLDTLIAGLGDVLTKTTSRAAPGETATDRKVGYRLTLRSLTAVPARESYKLEVATSDVPAEYRSLQEKIAEAKGHIRAINLNEQDKFNTTATLDFSVPTAERAKFDGLLADMGDTLNRTTIRVPQHEIASERKIGYLLSLRNLATIEPRESYHLQIATQDVAAEYRKLQDAVVAVKGQIKAIGLNEQDKINTTAQVYFDVAAAERAKFDKLIASIGEITVKKTERVPLGQTATSRNVGYRLTLSNIAAVPPREVYTLQAVSLDVPAGFRKLQDAVAAVGGQIRVGQLNEPDKLNISAQFDFDVPKEKGSEIEKLLVELGEVYTRTTARANPGEVATERKLGYRLTLRSVTGMPPREQITAEIKVADVERTVAEIDRLVRDKAGTIERAPIDKEADGRVRGRLVFYVPLAAKSEILRQFERTGNQIIKQGGKLHPQVPETKLTTVYFDIHLTNTPPIVPSDEGMGAQLRRSLSYSFWFLSWSLMFIVFGLMAVLPWALLLWLVVKLVKKSRGKQQPAAAAG